MKNDWWEDNTSELKPCPFCGGEAKHFIKVGSTKAVCLKCHTQITSLIESGYTAGLLWNKRPNEDKLNEELGRLDAQIDFLKWDAREYKETIDNLIEVGDVLTETLDPDCETEASAIFQEIAFEWKELK